MPPLDFTSQNYLRNPIAGLARLRAAGPIELVVRPGAIRWRQRPGLKAIEKLPVEGRGG